MPSPMNLSSVPSYLKSVSTISSKYSLSISTMTLGGRALAHRGEAADVAVEDRELLDELAALFHLELAAHHLLGDVRRHEAREAVAHDDLLLDLLREDRVLDEHRRLAGDRRDDLEVLRLELRERLGVEPHDAEHFLLVLVEERHDHGARDPVQDHRFALRRREVHRRVVREHARALLDDVVEDRRADLDGRVAAVAPAGGARVQRAVVLAQQDDAAVGLRELEEGEQDLVEQAVEVALEADVARELPRDAEALVVEAELLRVVADRVERQEALGLRGDLRADGARGVEHVDARAAEARAARLAPAGPRAAAGCAAAGAGAGMRRTDTAAAGAVGSRAAPSWPRGMHRRRQRRPARLAAAMARPRRACPCRGCACWTAPGPTGGSGERDARAVVVASARRAERDLVAVLEQRLAADALAVDVRAVEAAEVAQDEAPVALLEDAVLLRDDLVEELDRVVRVAPEAVDRPKLDRLLSFGGREDQPRP